MFCDAHFIISTMQAGTTPIFKVFGLTGPSTNPEIEPKNPLGQCCLPAGKMKLEFLENPSSTLLGYSRISNLIQAHFFGFSGNSLLVLARFGNNSSY